MRGPYKRKILFLQNNDRHGSYTRKKRIHSLTNAKHYYCKIMTYTSERTACIAFVTLNSILCWKGAYLSFTVAEEQIHDPYRRRTVFVQKKPACMALTNQNNGKHGPYEDKRTECMVHTMLTSNSTEQQHIWPIQTQKTACIVLINAAEQDTLLLETLNSIFREEQQT